LERYYKREAELLKSAKQATYDMDKIATKSGMDVEAYQRK